MQGGFWGKCLVCSGMDGNCPNNWASAAEIQQKNEKPMVKTPCDPEPNCLVEGGRKVGGWSSLFYQFGNSGCAKVVLADTGCWPHRHTLRRHCWGRRYCTAHSIGTGVGPWGAVRHTVSYAGCWPRGVLAARAYFGPALMGGGGAAPLTRRRGRRGIRNRACVGECMARAWRTLW